MNTNNWQAIIQGFNAYCGSCKTALKWNGGYVTYKELKNALFPHFCPKCGIRYELLDSYNTTVDDMAFVDMSPSR